MAKIERPHFEYITLQTHRSLIEGEEKLTPELIGSTLGNHKFREAIKRTKIIVHLPEEVTAETTTKPDKIREIRAAIAEYIKGMGGIIIQTEPFPGPNNWTALAGNEGWVVKFKKEFGRHLPRENNGLSFDHPGLWGEFVVPANEEDLLKVAPKFEGPNLHHVIRNNKLKLLQKISIIRQVAEGLAHLHEQGYSPYDVKPENILVDIQEDGGVRAYYSDLDLLRIKTASGFQNYYGTRRYTYKGALNYPPRRHDERDIYALGVTFLELILDRTVQWPDEEIYDAIAYSGWAAKGLKSLLSMMISPDLTERPPARYVAKVLKELEEKEPELRQEYEKNQAIPKIKFLTGIQVGAALGSALALAGTIGLIYDQEKFCSTIVNGDEITHLPQAYKLENRTFEEYLYLCKYTETKTNPTPLQVYRAKAAKALIEASRRGVPIPPEWIIEALKIQEGNPDLNQCHDNEADTQPNQSTNR